MIFKHVKEGQAIKKFENTCPRGLERKEWGLCNKMPKYACIWVLSQDSETYATYRHLTDFQGNRVLVIFTSKFIVIMKTKWKCHHLYVKIPNSTLHMGQVSCWGAMVVSTALQCPLSWLSPNISELHVWNHAAVTTSTDQNPMPFQRCGIL